MTVGAAFQDPLPTNEEVNTANILIFKWILLCVCARCHVSHCFGPKEKTLSILNYDRDMRESSAATAMNKHR